MRSLKRSCASVLFGLMLSLATGCGSSRTNLEAKTASLPEPKIFNEVKAIPSLDARLTQLRFFASGPADVAPLKNPVYQNRFEHAATQRIHPEIHIEYPSPGKRVYFNWTVQIRQNGKILRIVESQGRLEPNWSSSHHSVGIGILGAGNWRPGTYEAELYINGAKMAVGYFQVY